VAVAVSLHFSHREPVDPPPHSAAPPPVTATPPRVVETAPPAAPTASADPAVEEATVGDPNKKKISLKGAPRHAPTAKPPAATPVAKPTPPPQKPTVKGGFVPPPMSDPGF
jgi:hypothetical protein